jgi:hypothetical protein
MNGLQGLNRPQAVPVDSVPTHSSHPLSAASASKATLALVSRVLTAGKI